ncbi:recombinase family protein [Streptomyces sp. ISL-98]|uniref:recombinase family protein n=1 Tax=Streptomyces sp. ISL-98 TaxID=2819192 RepID=UPI001BEBD259|nr:recombinase family protein [Streptomyces sp. ISL-98]MBT2508784.1 recombinase family protein [Streptomyces sp. ISL-98]
MTYEPADHQLACIYCRISSDREGAGLAVERQREDCEQLADQLGLKVLEVYEDNDLSAYSGKPRPGYKRLLDDLRAGRAGVVLAWHTDRLHRSPTELEEYIDVCQPQRIDTRTVKAGNLDLTTATGRMIARQLGVQARYEVERMIERQKRSRDQMAEKGKYFGGPRPFGWEKGGVTQVPEEIAALREACQALLAGASLRAVAADFNERGIHTSSGGQWVGPDLRQVLLRPRNAGIIKHRGEEAGRAVWEPALDEPLWRSVVALLKEPSRRTVTTNVRKHLGSNLYVCGVCGCTLRASSKNSGKGRPMRSVYRCREADHVTRSQPRLDDHVQLAVLERVSRPDAAELMAQREDPVDVRGTQEEMRAARETLDSLAGMLGSGGMDLQEWRVASAAARARLKDAELVMSRAVKANPVGELLDTDDPEAAWNRFDLSRRRSVVDYLMTVRVMPSRGGRLPGGQYWDAATVQIEWK